MKGLRADEEWARQLVAAALQSTVVQHDDGSVASMHDLMIHYSDGTLGAVEVTSALDSDATVLWNLMNGGGRWIEDELIGGWMVTLLPTARAKRVRTELPVLLRSLEESGRRSVRVRPHGGPEGVEADLRELGVARLSQSGTDFPGSIYVSLELPAERTGGFVADTGDALSIWLGEFLAGSDRADVRAKLARSNLLERHVFVVMGGFTTAPFGVTDLLMRDGAPLPTSQPELPPEVTDVWALSTWSSGRGMRWCSRAERWMYFSKAVPTSDGRPDDAAVGSVD